MTLRRPGAARLVLVLGGCFALVAAAAVLIVGWGASGDALTTAAVVMMGLAFVAGALTAVLAVLVLDYTADREPDDGVAVTVAGLAGSLFVAVFGILALRTTGWQTAVLTVAALVVITHVVLRRRLPALLS